jgi:hypothetical protein
VSTTNHYLYHLFITALLLFAMSGPATFAAHFTACDDPECDVQPHYYYVSDVATVFEKAVEALKALKWKIKSTDPEGGVVVAKTPMTMLTGGDKVTVLVHQLDDGRVEVDITSKTSYQLIAWGKNIKNILRFYEYLDQLMGVSRDS